MEIPKIMELLYKILMFDFMKLWKKIAEWFAKKMLGSFNWTPSIILDTKLNPL